MYSKHIIFLRLCLTNLIFLFISARLKLKIGEGREFQAVKFMAIFPIKQITKAINEVTRLDEAVQVVQQLHFLSTVLSLFFLHKYVHCMF